MGGGRAGGKRERTNFQLRLGCANLSTNAKALRTRRTWEEERKGWVESKLLPPPTLLSTSEHCKKGPQPVEGHPRCKSPSQKPFSLPPQTRRESDVPSLHKCFPRVKLKVNCTPFQLASTEAENPVPRHFTLNVETTQLIKCVHQVCLLACLFQT